jgi:hypothetical protein
LEIVEISKSDFDALSLVRLWSHEDEWAWLADTSGRLVGVVILDPTTCLWSYRVCERSEEGAYPRITFADGVRDGVTAKLELVGAMQRLQ